MARPASVVVVVLCLPTDDEDDEDTERGASVWSRLQMAIDRVKSTI